MKSPQGPQGRIDVHSHLLPGIDDGCPSLEHSLTCARELVNAGYTHTFVTPHVWPSNPHIKIESIRKWAEELQTHLNAASIPLKLIPGGEISLTEKTPQTPPDEVVTYGLAQRHVLVDFWVDKLPKWVEPSIAWLQSLGLTVVLAHPERMRAIQDDPALADFFAERGVLLQGNLQCFSDPPHMATRRTAERFFAENRYFMVGTDLHNPATLPPRLAGLERVRELADDQTFRRLTFDNPRTLLPD